MQVVLVLPLHTFLFRECRKLPEQKLQVVKVQSEAQVAVACLEDCGFAIHVSKEGQGALVTWATDVAATVAGLA